MPNWSYSGDPRKSALDEVRMLIGDTDSAQLWTLLDAEIQYAVSLYSDNPPQLGRNFRAAAECADAIIAKLKGTVADKHVGDLGITYNNAMLQAFLERARQLHYKANIQGVTIYAGGISLSDKEANDDDTDRVKPAFEIDGMSEIKQNIDPRTGQSN